MSKIPLNTLVISTEKCGHWGAVDANTVGFTFREEGSKVVVVFKTKNKKWEEHAVGYKQIKPV
jgi:hypothetical protein